MTKSRTYSQKVPTLLDTHFQQLHHGSGISVDIIQERGFRSVVDKTELKKLGFADYQCQVPGMLIPIWEVYGHQNIYLTVKVFL